MLLQIEDYIAKVEKLKKENEEHEKTEEELNERIEVLEEKLANKKERWDV